MKNKFYEFYKLPNEKVNEIWEKGLLIVDTNVLLDLYRLGKASRNDLKKSIEFFKNRIWLPYQVGLEFHRNRENVIKTLGGSRYDEFLKLLNDKIENLQDAFKSYQRHPCIDYNYIEKRILRLKEELKGRVEVWKKEYPFDAENDEVLKWVTEKYDGKVGEDNTIEELLAIYKEGDIRYKANVPPGYKDANDKEKKDAGLRYVYGDLIIWKSVMAKAKKDKVDIIYLTNDNKEDWYEKYKGQTKGPRFELFREFHRETGQDIIIMSEASFLSEMKEKKSVKVRNASIEDAQWAMKTDFSNEWMNHLLNSRAYMAEGQEVLFRHNYMNGFPDYYASMAPMTIPGVTESFSDSIVRFGAENGLENSALIPNPINDIINSSSYYPFEKDEDVNNKTVEGNDSDA